MSTNLQSVLADREYKNWLRAGLSLKYARQGILNLVKNDIDNFHQDILMLLAGSKCNSCQIIQTRGVFSIRCPNSVCDKIFTEISNEHRFKPAWHNTDCRMWCNQAWQLAKCYMSPGYASKVSAADTDFPGLVSVIINNRRFDHLVNDNMGINTNIFCQARDVRNTILHKANMRVTDTDLADYIQTLQTMLSNPKCSTTDIQDAQTRLIEIQNGSLFVTTEDIDEIKAEACRAIEEKKQEALSAVNKSKVEAEKVIEGKRHKAMSDISSEADVHVKKLRVDAEAIKQTSNDCKKAVATQETVSVKAVTYQEADSVKAVTYQEAVSVKAVTSKEAYSVKAVTLQEAVSVKAVTSQEADSVKAVTSQEAVSVKALTSQEAVSVAGVKKAVVQTRKKAEMAIKETADTACSETKKVLEANKQDILSVVTSQELSSVAAVNKARVEAESSIQKQQDAGMADNPVDRNRKALQKHLISTYQEELSTPLSPVFQIDDMNIEEMYVEPNMKLINPQKEPKDTGVPINSYQDIFGDERKKNIYVLGDAGMGKTSLCKKIISTWCQVHSKTIDNMSKDQLAMTKFDYLFYISLRDTVSIKGVEEMIKYQLRLERFQDQLPEVLENEKCLIILDGLDEWTTENTDARSSSINKGIPGRQGITNCTVLTTTRPAKFEAIQLKTTQIDTKVELLGIENRSSVELIEIIIGFLNTKYHSRKTKKECLHKLDQRGLSCFFSIPVILKQLICLWYFGKHLGTTKCAIYSQMFELHLEMAESRLNKDPEFLVKKEEWKNSKVQLPSCFDDKPKCQLFKPLIVALSNISFETLVSDNQESSLVFNRSQAEFYGLTSTDINICLKIGILSQNKIMVDCNSQMKKVSFLHKTFQEYFAALFVFNNQSDPEKCTELMKKLNKDMELDDIMDVDEYFSRYWNTPAKQKDFKLENVITFISGMCLSETTCMFVNSCDKLYQTTLEHCLEEGWRCNHDNKHLQCDEIQIDTKYQPEPLELLCQANIHHMKTLWIRSRPTARCLEYILQVDTLEKLSIWSSTLSSSPISEDNMYSLIQHNTHTLTYLYIANMTLQSRASLTTLLYNIQHLSELYTRYTTMSQQLLDSLQELKAQKPDMICVDIFSSTRLPDIKCTD